MPRVKRFNENKVLSNATELFWEQGYHATSIQDLVSHLGINRGSLYDTYGGKNNCFTKHFNYIAPIIVMVLQPFLKIKMKLKMVLEHYLKWELMNQFLTKIKKGVL